MKRFTISKLILLKLFLYQFWLHKFQEGLEIANPVKAETHYATNCCDKSWRQVAPSLRRVASCALLLPRGCLRLFCRCDLSQFEFVRQIEATKFCSIDNDFHMSHEATCCSNLSRRRVAATCRTVCLGLYCTAQKAL